MLGPAGLARGTMQLLNEGGFLVLAMRLCDMEEESGNFVVRLYRGDVSLPITFWVFWFLIGSVTYFVTITFDVDNSIYRAFIALALWNSASKYQGLALWRILAQIIAGLEVITLALWLAFMVLAAISAV